MRGGESMARIIMCGSFKGGVGKTASSWNLAYSLARWEKGFICAGKEYRGRGSGKVFPGSVFP